MGAARCHLALPVVANSVTRLVVRPHHRSSGHYSPGSQRPFALMCRNFGQHLPRPLFGRQQLSRRVSAQCKVLGLHVGRRYRGTEPDCDFALDKRAPCSCCFGKGFFSSPCGDCAPASSCPQRPPDNEVVHSNRWVSAHKHHAQWRRYQVADAILDRYILRMALSEPPWLLQRLLRLRMESR